MPSPPPAFAFPSSASRSLTRPPVSCSPTTSMPFRPRSPSSSSSSRHRCHPPTLTFSRRPPPGLGEMLSVLSDSNHHGEQVQPGLASDGLYMRFTRKFEGQASSGQREYARWLGAPRTVHATDL